MEACGRIAGRKKDKTYGRIARSGRFVNRPYGEGKMEACGSNSRSCGKLELTTPKTLRKEKQGGFVKTRTRYQTRGAYSTDTSGLLFPLQGSNSSLRRSCGCKHSRH